MDLFNFDLAGMLISLPAIIIGLTFHEYAHGWAAYKLGDPTAKMEGRLTLNPLAHLDPIGFIALLLFRFGWAKPVPINPLNFKGDRKTGIVLVSLAGPLSNLLLAFLSGILLYLIQVSGNMGILEANNQVLFLMLYYLISINVILAVFNLIPVPPLDGSKILAGLLPGSPNWLFQLERYGFIILILLMITGVFSIIIKAVAIPICNLILNLALT